MSMLLVCLTMLTQNTEAEKKSMLQMVAWEAAVEK